MSSTETQLERLRQWNAATATVETELGGQEAEFAQEAFAPPATEEEALAQESIIMRRRRPVLAIKNDSAELQFADEVDSALWGPRLLQAMPHIERAARAVGRIDLVGGPLEWVGTGWLVADDVLVTNRHVAREFARRDGAGFTFSPGGSGPIGAFADFLQESGNPATRRFELLRPLYIQEAPGPDVAFFEIAPKSDDVALAAPLMLAGRPEATENAAVIGYPAYDSRIPEPELMERIYGRVYNKKRLAPGAVTDVDPKRLLHNCTTLGGNSGSVVLDLDTGEALGLHYSGSFLTTNYAVRADIVGQLLDEVRSGRTRAHRREPASDRPSVRATDGEQSATAGSRPSQVVGEVTIPLTITVSVGEAMPSSRSYRPQPSWQQGQDDAEDEVEGLEGRVEDYRDRGGYVADFLGPEVPLPKVRANGSDVLTFELDGKTEHELRYEHFSVVMSRSRRMCFFSAVNISGRQSRKSKRGPWRWDPRLPRTQQIMKECYGNPPRFSRGHMTRREDPSWGDETTADRGNQDSMHVTNVAPQMQAFNSPIWLALEDYALDNARSDKMDISVFTGPYFRRDDPVMYGVQVPVAFWKIIAFIHEETRQLCATGYELDQRQSMVPEEEFVFGQFVSPQLGIATQVPIAAITRRSGLSFEPLATHDPLSPEQELTEGAAVGRRLMATNQIRFIA
ncbi:DNA/RNA non-specific endonuclease [Sphingomonas lacusdianchii]|uniref:DNA/RNA non-specific endonuclease n=1 Tax=Sphingomonas lacusdianchii TaxID=2917992 RepID=UPI001F55DE36|nr:DNA/RNA non-specific endonuclease [Sphingomonas sp. JXJ CY 53]